MPAPAQRATTNGRPASGPPKLVNRGPGGLLRKGTGGWTPVPSKTVTPAANPQLTKAKAKYRIAPGLQHMAVPIDSVTPDPMNARLHPERNMEAIKESLETYGQVKTIVVNKLTGIVTAGNGTLAAAKELGWTEIAANFVEMSEAEAAGYGLADNRTAELAKWNYENAKALEMLIAEAGLPMTGWATHELVVLRAAEWVAPKISDALPEGSETVKITLTREQKETLDIAVGMIREREGKKDLTEGECLHMILNDFVLPPGKYDYSDDENQFAEE